MDRHTGRLRGRVCELYPHGSLNHLYGAFLPGPLSQLLFIWFTVHIQYISGSSHVYMHLLAKMDSISKAYGWPGLS